MHVLWATETEVWQVSLVCSTMMTTTNALTIYLPVLLALVVNHTQHYQQLQCYKYTSFISRTIYDMILLMCEGLERRANHRGITAMLILSPSLLRDCRQAHNTVDHLNWRMAEITWSLVHPMKVKCFRMLLRLCAARNFPSLRKADWPGQITVEGGKIELLLSELISRISCSLLIIVGHILDLAKY